MNARWKWIFVVWMVMAAVGSCFAGIEPQVKEILRSADLRQTEYGLYAVDLQTQRELIAINEHRPMLPASNLKLITTAAALGILGPDYMFRTELSLVELNDIDGKSNVDQNTGEQSSNKRYALLVKGDGDPAFGDPVLLDRLHDMTAEDLLLLWVKMVKQTGISNFDCIVIDDRVFDQEFVHPSWPEDQLNNWWCAPVAGINYYDNCLDLLPSPTSQGLAPKVNMTPRSPFLRPSMRAVTGDRDTFWASRRPESNNITYKGKIRNRLSEPVQVTIYDPPMYFGRLLKSRLSEAGITVDDIRRPQADEHIEPSQCLHLVQTSLPEILKRCNSDSQNLFAEALIKRCGRMMTGLPGSWTTGSSVTRFFLHEKLGAEAANVSIADGSGLSRDNQVTSKVMVSLLKAMYRDQTAWPIYRDSLSVAGVDGTLQKRMNDLNGQVHGKSGSIDGVKTLSGYLIIPRQGQPDRVVAFSFLFNNIRPPVYGGKIKNVQDDLVRLLDSYMKEVVEIEAGNNGG